MRRKRTIILSALLCLCLCLTLSQLRPPEAGAESYIVKVLATTSYTPVALMEAGEITAATSTPGDFYYHMAKRFPTASLNIYSNEMNAEVFKGGREWAWNEDPDERWLAFRTAWREEK